MTADRPRIVGRWGEQCCDDGDSRPFPTADTLDPREIVAQVLAVRDGWAEIRPNHWATAGAVVKALKAAGRIATVAEMNRRTSRAPADGDDPKLASLVGLDPNFTAAT